MSAQMYGLPALSSFAPQAATPSSPTFQDPDLEPSSPKYGNTAQFPPPDVLLGGYTRAMADANGSASRRTRPRSSAHLNVNDPVAMHLLVETAMGDSQDFEILSFEELEALKKEQSVLASRIDGLRRKLALESKVRDAALSLNRLYSTKGRPSSTTSSPKHNRRSLGASRGSSETIPKKDPLVQSKDELAASAKKCEELARELYHLEMREREVQTWLLKHTAGVLQMTHEGPSNRSQGMHSLLSDGMAQGARPDSPASIYTYEDSRARGLQAPEDNFDDRSLYRLPDSLDGIVEDVGRGKSLRRASRPSSMFSGDSSLRTEAYKQALLSVEKRLEDFNDHVRELVVQADPERDEAYAAPPKRTPETVDTHPGAIVDQQLDFLFQGLKDIEAEHTVLQQNTRQTQTTVEGRLQGINKQIANIINSAYTFEDGDYPAPPQVSGHDLQNQLHYMEQSMYSVEQIHQSLLQAAEESRTKSTDQLGQTEQYNVVLAGLWQIILAGEEEVRKDKRQRRAMLATDSDADDDSDTSSDEEADADQPFSLSAFSTKVQRLCSRAAALQEQQSTLRRQVQEQREINSKLDAQRDVEREELNTQLSQVREQLFAARDELANTISQLEQLRDESSAHTAEREAHHQREAALLADLQARQEQIENLEAYIAGAVQAERESHKQTEDDLREELSHKEKELADLASALEDAQDDARIAHAEVRAKLSETQERVDELTAALQAAQQAKEAAETALQHSAQALQEKEAAAQKATSDLRALEADVVRLQTEVTVARAELDGAYGTRAQRAAEVAASSNSSNTKAQLDELASKNSILSAELEALRGQHQDAVRGQEEAAEREARLRRELEETVGELEELTRASVEGEREREGLEVTIDRLRERVEGLEGQLSDERVRWLGVRSPTSADGGGGAGGGAVGETTSTMVLKNEFKKMMRETRAEGVRALRVEQEERKKLEALVRTLKREQRHGKSGLSQSVTAV